MTTLQELSTSMASAVTESSAAVVRVEGRRRLAASGIVWAADGLIITAHHVVERDDEIGIGLPDGNHVTATVVGREPGIDLAVLRATATDLTAAQWSDWSALAVGQLVLAMGRPGGQVQATLGIVSALGGEWQTHGGGKIDGYLQTDVTMYPGFSGGPLLSASGEFAGMNTSGLTRGASVTVPAQTLQRVVNAILTHGHVPRAYLGIGVQPVHIAEALQESVKQPVGLMIMSVEATGPAAKAALYQGDVLLTIDGKSLQQVSDLQSVLQMTAVDSTVTVQLLRGGEIKEAAVQVGGN